MHLVTLVVVVVLVFFVVNRCTLTCNSSSEGLKAKQSGPEYWTEFCKSIQPTYPAQHRTPEERNEDRAKCLKAGYETTDIEMGPGGGYQLLPWEKY
jgi:hypothetical protein